MAINPEKAGILIVDTVAEYRDYIKQALESNTDMNVLASAPNGNIGQIKARDMKPDIIILDAELQDVIPCELTRILLERDRKTGIIITVRTSPKPELVERALKSLECGAFDVVVKPSYEDGPRAIDELNRKLSIKIRGFLTKKYTAFVHKTASKVPLQEPPARDKILSNKELSKGSRKGSYRVVAIGISTGGPKALQEIIGQFPRTFSLPVLIVLHLPRIFTESMALELAKKALIPVKVAVDGEEIMKGTVYLAPGGMHMAVTADQQGPDRIRLDDGPPENGCKPSVDVTFRSLAETYLGGVLAVICTGMGEDGTKGLARLKHYPVWSIAQDQETSIVWGMPGAAVSAGLVDEILPLQKIVPRIVELT